MSIGFLLSGPADAVIWRGPKKNGNTQNVYFFMTINEYIVIFYRLTFFTFIKNINRVN